MSYVYIAKIGGVEPLKLKTFNELLNILEGCKQRNIKVVFKKVLPNETERNVTREVRAKYERQNNPAQISLEQYNDIMRCFNYQCAYCSESLFNKRLERDHVQPLSAYGLNRADNVIPACRRCNASKGAKHYYDWYKQQEFFDRKKLAKVEAFLIINQIKFGGK